MPATAPVDRQPLVAPPARRAVHLAIAFAGWALFAWWWWLVVRRVSGTEIRFTLLFIAVALLVIVGVTAIWALHNRAVFRRKGARTRVRDVPGDFTRDTLGRPVGLPTVPEECLYASVIVVRIEDGRKVYRPTVIRQPGRGDDERQVGA
jgi:hypothetical protein